LHAVIDQKFSRYEIKAELGIGGMATVYRAYDPMFEREVAVKVLKRELLEDTQLRERFERETKIVAKLEHGAIVPVYDVGHDENKQLFYVMRYMSGGTLSERIEQGLTLSEVGYIVLRLSAALDYAHSKGIVHRDLKPGNILYDEYNNPFISDFGIAKIAQAATRITSSGIIGTPRYMSPEQARGEEADGRSDLYSLGIILFEMLSGKTPFEATTPLAMAYKHAMEDPPSILDVNPNLPAGIDAVFAKALAKQPKDRYNTCAEFAHDFFEIFPEATTSNDLITPPPPRSHIISQTPTELPPKPLPPEPEPVVEVPTSKPNSTRWIMGGFAALILIIFGTWGVSQLSGTHNASTPTSQVVTATQTVSTPTTSPTETAAPTEIITPTIIPVIVNPGIGNADQIAVMANNDIYMMNINEKNGVDGRNARQITNTNISKFDLQWLPGGKQLLYVEGRCVFRIDALTSGSKPEQVTCFNGDKFFGFRVSPDGANVAISIENRLIILPLDWQQLATVGTAFELQNSANICLDYADVTVKRAQWSADGKSLAVLYQSVIGKTYGDTIRVMSMDLQRCKEADPLITDEFPASRFTPDGFAAHPLIPAFTWDGNNKFLLNTYKRNAGYGDLYLYDASTGSATKINPVRGICCYRDAAFSPDGSYILLFFQNEAQGANSETQMYYIALDQLGSDITPIKLPVRFFPNPRENLEAVLHPANP
jgi:serine/threonine protein kinase